MQDEALEPARRHGGPPSIEEASGSGVAQPQDDAQGESASTERRLDDRWLRALSLDLYGRPALPKERSTWLGRPVNAYITAALADVAAWKHWFDAQLYYFMLIDQFRPASTGLGEVPKLLAERRMSARDALHRIARSTSFDARNPGADTFVTVIMEQICGIEVQTSKGELKMGKAAYDGGSGVFLGERAKNQSDVVRVAVNHKKAARHLVAREFLRLTRRPAGKRDVAKAGKELEKEPGAFHDLFAAWLRSDEYAARVTDGAPMSNRVWIRSVFIDLGGELPSDDDIEALRSALDGLGDPAPLRSAIIRMLLNADGTRAPRGPAIEDAEAWVGDTFRRLLGREPREDEAETFLAAVRDAADGPEIVLYTLLTSEEYETP